MADETQGGGVGEINQVRGVVPTGAANGTGGAGKAADTSREVYLRVAEAFPFDIHRGIARLDQASFDALGLQPGGLIHLTGKRRTTIRVDPRAGSMVSDRPIRGDGPDGEVDAEGIEVRGHGERVIFNGRVRLLLRPDEER